jgi:hypothetical protein
MSYKFSISEKCVFFTGMVLGGMVVGKSTSKEVGKLYGAVNAVAIFVLREMAKMRFEDGFLNLPPHWQIACITPMATLITGAAANYFEVPLNVMMVTKIAAAAIAGGIGTIMICGICMLGLSMIDDLNGR